MEEPLTERLDKVEWEPGDQRELKAIGRYEFVPFFYCSDGFLWLGFLKSEEQCLKKKSTAGIGETVSYGWGAQWCWPGAPRAALPPTAAVWPAVWGVAVWPSEEVEVFLPEARLTLLGVEVQQLLNESKVFFPHPSRGSEHLHLVVKHVVDAHLRAAVGMLSSRASSMKHCLP